MAPSISELQPATTDPVQAAKQNVKQQEVEAPPEVVDNVRSI